MDTTDLRIFATVLSFACFIGILFWAFNGRRNKDFDEAAKLPFTEDDEFVQSGDARSAQHHGAKL